jgi:hypothetical protein
VEEEVIDSKAVLSDIVVFNKYAKYLPEKSRRETWIEACTRTMDMHIKKYPFLEKEIREVFERFVFTKKVFPSMRSLQFAGPAIEKNPARIYNCSYAPIDHPAIFSEALFLLLAGCGVGFSVQFHHIEKLPAIKRPGKPRRFLIGDSVEGWADAVKMLCKAYFYGKSLPDFDFSDIREKGLPLITSGGKAPGPEPLKTLLHNIQMIFERKKEGEQLKSIECHDIMCHLAMGVMSGGIRRASCISIFSIDDEDMLTAKSGNWYELNPQRCMANNTVLLLRHRITQDDFLNLWERIKDSGSGEPGFYFSNNSDYGFNPCCFTGDMKLRTIDGDVCFKELSSRKALKVTDFKGHSFEGKVWSNGFKKVVKITNSYGEKLKCTPEHRFMTIEGDSVEAKNLKNRRIMPFFSIRENNDDFVKMGFLQGDGCLGRLKSERHKGLEICIGEDDRDIANLFEIKTVFGETKYYTNGYNDKLKELGFDSSELPQRVLPSTFSSWTNEEKLSFLRGLYSANGCVIKGSRVSFKTTSKGLVDQLSSCLLDIGIKTYFTTNKPTVVKFKNGDYLCKESYDLNILDHKAIVLFAEKIGFVHEYKKNSLIDLILNKSPKIISVKEERLPEEVFDFTIENDNHWGVVNGYVAHNCEISLKPCSFCNLSEINISTVTCQSDLNERAIAASFIGTLQAGYTDFHYLRDVWKRTTEKEALIGVSQTGIASNAYKMCNLKEASSLVLTENVRVSKAIGINPAKRACAIKPSGTTSLCAGSSSGIHAWFSEYYIRRMKLQKSDALYAYLKKTLPELVEDCVYKPRTDAFVFIPIAAPYGATTSDNETAIELLERIKYFSENWIKPGHVSGDNTHNVSATVYIDTHEWDTVAKWMWDNRDCYNGLSVLPKSGHTYKQTPFEKITKERYDELIKYVKSIDLTQVIEKENKTDLKSEAACSGGLCELTY